MPLARRIPNQYPNFDLPVSYKIADDRRRLRDALNVHSYQGRLDSRFGYTRFNATSLGGAIQSVSFYKKDDGTALRIVKVGAVLYSVDQDENATSIKTGLTAASRHRGLTKNGRHIIAVEGDGFFSFDGTIFSQLGQAPPPTPVLELEADGNLTIDTYEVKTTYYASSIGFESNPSEASNQITTDAGPNQTLQVVLNAANYNSPANAFVDAVRIYVRNVSDGGDFIFEREINLPLVEDPDTGVSGRYNITDFPTSTTTPPDANAAPPGDDAKFMAVFGNKLVIVTGEFASEAVMSEEDLPDAFDDDLDATVLVFPLNGPLTGIAVGTYNGDSVSPYLIAFKRRSTHLYTEAGAAPIQVVLSDVIGCVSHDTIYVKNGDVHFLSEVGWRVIRNGKFVVEKGTNNPATLGDGDIDDIFVQKGFEYEVNRARLERAFSVYYEPLDQYMTWVCEGVKETFDKTYVYEYKTGGFKPFQFSIAATCACAGEDNRGRDCILFGDANGYLYQYSIHERKSDRNASNIEVDFTARAQIYWVPYSGDYDATYNFRELIVRAMANDNEITVKTWLNFNLNAQIDYAYNFESPEDTFILDESVLDEDLLGDSRGIVVAHNDINRVGESILIEFSQSAIGANLGLVSAQMDFSKNGNRNAS